MTLSKFSGMEFSMTPKPTNYWLNNPDAPDAERRIRQATNGYAEALVPFIAHWYGSDCLQQAWQEFMLGNSMQFNGDDAHSELFFSWFFHCWSPATAKANTAADRTLYGIPPTQAYLARAPCRLDPLLRQYLEVCLQTPFGFYQIVKCFPQSGFRAREVLSGMQIEVIDSLASTSLSNGDIIFARIPFLDGTWVMDAISPVSFPWSFQRRLFVSRSPESLKRSKWALRRLYFDLLEAYILERPEIRSCNGPGIAPCQQKGRDPGAVPESGD
jgi:hypothetical protein